MSRGMEKENIALNSKVGAKSLQLLKGSWICSLEQIGGYDVLTNVSFHLETVCLMSRRIGECMQVEIRAIRNNEIAFSFVNCRSI
jgi:hypothetical protein